MTTDLIETAQGVMTQVESMLAPEVILAAHPFGHTPFQIHRFILNDHDHPGAERFRQTLRELWARREAYYQVRDRLEDIRVDRLLAQADLAQAQSGWSLRPWSRWRHAARAEAAQNRLKRLDRIERDLILDLEHRVIREAKEFLKEAAEHAPQDATVFSDEHELSRWKQKANDEPRLKAMLGRT